MTAEIRIKVGGKWYKPRKSAPAFYDKCKKCKVKRACRCAGPFYVSAVRRVCEIYDYGFSEIKDNCNDKHDN